MIALRLLGLLLAAVGAGSLAVTLQPGWAGVPVVLMGGALLARPGSRRSGAAAGLVVGLLLLAARGWIVAPSEWATVRIESLEAGQYTARSDDPLHLVHARAVVREGGHLIFAEAHGLPPLGLDRGTLYHRPHRWLFYQGPPPDIAPDSDPDTVQLVDAALRKALSGESPREEPRLPEGARVEGDHDTYWDMFPSEFDHRCEVTLAPDGLYRGTSSNPAWSVEVEIEVRGGRLVDVKVLRQWSSGYGRDAFAKMPGQMVRNNRVDVDVVSGATRSSLLIRSAAYHACLAARAAAQP